MRKILLFGSSALGAAAVIGVGALAFSSGSSALVSNSIPTSQVAASTSSTPAAGHPHVKHVGLRKAVYSQTVVPIKGGGYKTVEMVKGSLTTISSSAISVTRPDTGTVIAGNITPSTKFRNTTEAALVADLSVKPAVTVRIVERDGNVVMVGVPGTKPTTHGTFSSHAKSSNSGATTAGSSATA